MRHIVHTTHISGSVASDDSQHALLGQLGQHVEDRCDVAFRALLRRLHLLPARSIDSLWAHARPHRSILHQQFLSQSPSGQHAPPRMGRRWWRYMGARHHRKLHRLLCPHDRSGDLLRHGRRQHHDLGAVGRLRLEGVQGRNLSRQASSRDDVPLLPTRPHNQSHWLPSSNEEYSPLVVRRRSHQSRVTPISTPAAVRSPHAMRGVLCASPTRPSGPSRIIPP